jgi:two-component system response regulator AtoC
MVLLALESENGAVLTYRLNKTQFSVGSSSRNDVVVRAPGIADRHLVMQRSGSSFTFVTTDRQTVVLNGERRSRGVLNPGDRVRIGSMTLVYRGGDAGTSDVGTAPAPAVRPPARTASAPPVFLSDPAGFATTRTRLVDLFDVPRSDCLQRLVGLIREALPEVEVAILLPSEGEDPVPLASVWDGALPRVRSAILGELATAGRYAQLAGGKEPVIVVPVLAPSGEIVAMMTARPLGALGREAVALLCEAARLLGLRWRHIGRDRGTDGSWELEARQQLEAELPGTSQAVQVLRAGILAAAYGNDPVLVCGSDGVGRTEVARLLAAVGRRGGRDVVVLDGREGEENLRRSLFGPTGQPSFAPGGEGAVARATGATLVVRNVDTLPVAVQAELAGLISAQQNEPAGPVPVRWVITCGENPLALVQQGDLASGLFQVFSHFMLRVPRLAERREDLPLLIAGLLRRVALEQRKQLRGISLECLNSLLAHPFSGEMSELVSEINRLVTATPNGEMVRCEPGSGPTPAGGGAETPADVSGVLDSDNLKVTVPKVERLLIDRVMHRVKGNQSRGARALGISRGALIAKLKEYGIPDYRYLKKKKSGS